MPTNFMILNGISLVVKYSPDFPHKILTADDCGTASIADAFKNVYELCGEEYAGIGKELKPDSNKNIIKRLQSFNYKQSKNN